MSPFLPPPMVQPYLSRTQPPNTLASVLPLVLQQQNETAEFIVSPATRRVDSQTPLSPIKWRSTALSVTARATQASLLRWENHGPYHSTVIPTVCNWWLESFLPFVGLNRGKFPCGISKYKSHGSTGYWVHTIYQNLSCWHNNPRRACNFSWRENNTLLTQTYTCFWLLIQDIKYYRRLT